MRVKKNGFTILEILFALTIFSLVIIMVVNFMTRTNVEIGTATNQSIANERCTTLLSQFTNDVRKMKRGTISIPGSSFPVSHISFLSYKKNTDDKKSDKIVVNRIEYKFDKVKKIVVRKVYSVKFKKGKFKNKKEILEKKYKNFTDFEVLAKSEDGSIKHINILGCKVSTGIHNRALGHDQVWTDKTTVYIRDENYYEKQPHWNENALYTSSFVTITKGKLYMPDFSDFTKALKWIKDLKKSLPARMKEAAKDVFNATRQELAGQIFAKTDELKNKFLATNNINGVIVSAKKKMVDKIYKSFGKKSKFALAALYLKDKIYNSSKAAAAYKRIMNRKLTDEEILKLLPQKNGFFSFSKYKLPPISQSDIKFWKNYKDATDMSDFAKKRYDAINNYIIQGKKMIYNSIGKEKDFKRVLAGFSKIMSDEVKKKIRGDALEIVADDVVDKKVDELGNKAIDQIMKNLGITSALGTNLDPRIKNQLDKIVDSMNKDLKTNLIKIKEKVKKEIKTGVSQTVNDLSNSATSSLNSAKASGESSVSSVDVGKISSAMKNLPDPVNSAIMNVSDQILAGKGYNNQLGKFVKETGTTDYLEKLFSDFGLKLENIVEY